MNEQSWYSPTPLRPRPKASGRGGTLQEKSGGILILSALVGLGFALLFYRAGGMGLNFFLYALIWCVCAALAVRSLGLGDLRRDAFFLLGILLLGGAILWTSNYFLQLVSAAGCVVLQLLWALNVFVPIRDWSFLHAISSAVLLLANTFGACDAPFRQLNALGRKDRRVWREVGLGVLIAVPLLAVALWLLSSADAVFRQLFAVIDRRIIYDIILFLALFLLGFVPFFALLYAQMKSPAGASMKEPRRFPAAVAATFTALLSLVYLLFCAVQLVMLFRTDGTGLPTGVTYAEYAREGFFQLLVLSAMNVLLVMVSERYFTLNGLLRGLLTLIGGCTFALEASSLRRMLLYVRAYGFTFLRVLVLWFLCVLAIVLAAAVYKLYREDFPLFRFTLGVCLGLWLLFVYARPDALAVRYDLRRFGCGEIVYELIREDLSADGVAELEPYIPDHGGEMHSALGLYFERELLPRRERAGIRGYNLALWRAAESAERITNE